MAHQWCWAVHWEGGNNTIVRPLTWNRHDSELWRNYKKIKRFKFFFRASLWLILLNHNHSSSFCKAQRRDLLTRQKKKKNKISGFIRRLCGFRTLSMPHVSRTPAEVTTVAVTCPHQRVKTRLRTKVEPVEPDCASRRTGRTAAAMGASQTRSDHEHQHLTDKTGCE